MRFEVKPEANKAYCVKGIAQDIHQRFGRASEGKLIEKIHFDIE